MGYFCSSNSVLFNRAHSPDQFYSCLFSVGKCNYESVRSGEGNHPFMFLLKLVDSSIF